MPDINPWEGVVMPGQNPAPGNAGPVRNTPLDNRAIRNMEILAGQAGDPLEHAVRFKDVQELEAKLLDIIQRNSSIFSVALARRIESQFQAIDTESKGVAEQITASFQTLEGLVATFTQTFTDALDTTNTNITTNYYTIAQTDSAIAALETSVGSEINGLETSVSTLSSSVDGIEGVHAIRIDNNGYISGYGLISSIRDGLPVSDFIISDASFRVVNSAGAGNYTPFAVYPTTRIVDGVTVPAGVYAENLYVTRANVSDAAINSAKIAELGVETLNIADNAVTVPIAAFFNGPGGFNNVPSGGLELVFPRLDYPILISFGGAYDPANTTDVVTFRLQAFNGPTLVYQRSFGNLRSAAGLTLMEHHEAFIDAEQASWPGGANQRLLFQIFKTGSASFNAFRMYITCVTVKK